MTTGRAIPRMAGWPVIGNALELAADASPFVMEAGRANGGLVEIRSWRRAFVAVTDPDLVRRILLTHYQKYRRSRAFGGQVLGESLLSIEGLEWQKRRRQVGSVFRFDVLDRLMPLVREETDRALGRWEELARAGEPIQLGEEVRRLVVLGLTRAMLSGMPADERSALAGSIQDGLRLVERRNRQHLHLPRGLPTPANLRLSRTISEIDGHLRPGVIRRRAVAAIEGSDLLDALLAARDPESGASLTDGQVIDEVKGLLAAGVDPTTAVITRTIERLARHAEASTAWLSELDREFDRRLPERADLAQLARLMQIVNETMRLHPPIPMLSRECVETDVLGGYLIPRGTQLLVSIQAVHRDERYWPEPEEFRPSRFARDWPRNAFLPFGAGQHGCVASNFALAHILMTLAMIGQRFRLSSEGGARKETPETPTDGMGVMLQVRSRG